jgi:hypothetical protein
MTTCPSDVNVKDGVVDPDDVTVVAEALPTKPVKAATATVNRLRIFRYLM